MENLTVLSKFNPFRYAIGLFDLADWYKQKWKILKPIKGIKGRIHKMYGCASKAELVARITMNFVCFLLDDVIEKGTVFKLPTKYNAYLYVGKDESLTHLVMRSKMIKDDKYEQLLNNNFETYSLKLMIERRGKIIVKDIWTDAHTQERINNSKANFITNLKGYRYASE